jgi:diguanylate cyclase (GGDEF)-like protein/PAS domain S-box-containing protein
MSVSPSLASRFPLREIALATAVVAMLAAFMVQQYRSQLALISDQHAMALDVAYRSTLETYRMDVATRFRLQVMRPEVLELMSEALATPEANIPVLRGRLYRQLKSVYEELKQSGLQQFQFHLADNRSLLRFHLPQIAGDPIFNLRPSVRIANTEKREVSGFEVGRTVPAFRYVFPVASEGRHLGSVEISISFDRIQENLSHLLAGGDFGLLLDKKTVLDTIDPANIEKFAGAPVHADFLIENPTVSRVARNLMQSDTVRALEPLLRRDTRVQEGMRAGESFVVPLTHDGCGYVVTFLSVKDLNARPVAYVVRFVQNDALKLLRDSLMRQGLLASLLIIALAVSMRRLSRQKLQLKDDIARREVAESGLLLYESVFQHSGEAIIVTDDKNLIVAANPAFTTLTGYAFDDVAGKDPRILASGNTPSETYQALWAGLQGSGYWQGELMDRRKNGEIFPKWATISVIRDPYGRITHHIASFTDISERKAAEARIEKLAHFDVLTGLLNRYSLESRLEQGLLAARRENEHMAVLFIDMDRFKTINDTLGHHMGDELLKEVARRLQSCVRESDIVARQGGDEFVVALTSLSAIHDVAPVVNKLMRALGDTYLIEGHTLRSSPSIGVAIYPEDGGSVETLLMNADTAMYHAKEKGRNNAQYFTAALTKQANERMAIEHDLYLALADQQFELYYQPKVCSADRSICGFEALLRWHHPEKGMVPPDKFIPVAEEAGLIHAIGNWVLDEACRQLALWQKQGYTGMHVAVNLSAHQLRSPHLALSIDDCLTRHGIDAELLELEVTESVAMENPERAIEQLKALRDLGLKLAIDDFGTGYSSLAYLKHLPIQTLKLDRSFVRDIETDPNDAAISAATIALAHTMGLKVVAEGVETEAQADYLWKGHGCDLLQGYLFGKPQPAAALEERLRQHAAGICS